MNVVNASEPLRLSLKKNFSWMFFGESVDILTRWGLIAVLSKLMDPGAVGLFGLSLAIVGPVFSFSNMGLRHAQSTDVTRAYHLSHYFTLRRFTTALALILIVVVAWLINTGDETWMVVMLVAVARAIEAQSDVYYGLFQSRERMDYIAQARMFRGPLALALFWAGVYFSSDLRVGCLGLISSNLIVLILHNYRKSKRFRHSIKNRESMEGEKTRFSFDFKRTYILFRLVFPLGCVGLLTSLQTNIPRYFVELELGLEQLGFFVAVFAPYSAVTRVLGAVAHSASARLAMRYRNSEGREFLLLLLKLGILGSVIGGIGIVVAVGFGGQVLTLLYTAEYSPYSDILVLMMIGAFVRALGNLWQFGVIAARRFWAQFMQHAVVVLVMIIGGPILVGLYGLTGAALVVIFGALTHLIGVLAINTFLMKRLAVLKVRQRTYKNSAGNHRD